jgi:hypothetical protein
MEEQEHQPTVDQEKSEGLLYHYTDQKGLLGILESKSIWATHLRYLNDLSEGEIVSRAVWQEINSRVNSDDLMQFIGIPPIEGMGKIECNDEEIISQGHGMSTWVTTQSVFVTSFSEKGNLLSQWRAYSGASGGYSIGFSQSYLRALGKHFLQDRPGRFYSDSNVLIRCRYFDDAEGRCLAEDLEDLVTSYINEATTAKQSQSIGSIKGFNNPGAIALKHFLQLGIRSAITKDYAFHEESEFRFVFVLNRDNTQTDLEFRTGRSSLTPYFKIPLVWDSQPIEVKKIIIGPCPYPNEAIESVKMLLKKENIGGVEVASSKIPYRN